VFLKENKPGKLSIQRIPDGPNTLTNPFSPVSIRKAVTDYVNSLDPNSQQAKDFHLWLGMVPPNQTGTDSAHPEYYNDVHPNILRIWMMIQPDNKQAFYLPKPTTIQIVDQDALQKLIDSHQPLPEPVYRTVTTTIITHHLIPTYKTVYTQFPV